MEKNDYKKWKDHELLVRVATKQDMMHEDVRELKDEDRRIHHRINDAHKRINAIKLWTGVSGTIGGIIGGFLAWLTGGKS